MFLKFLENVTFTSELDEFKAYIERLIEVDGEEHGELSRQLVTEICGDNQRLWQTAAESAKCAIHARIDFYSMIEMEIKNKNDN